MFYRYIWNKLGKVEHFIPTELFLRMFDYSSLILSLGNYQCFSFKPRESCAKHVIGLFPLITSTVPDEAAGWLNTTPALLSNLP